MKHLLVLALTTLTFSAHAADGISIPKSLSCTQISAVYGDYANDRVAEKKEITMKSDSVNFISKGEFDNEVIITLDINGELIRDLIFTKEDIAKFNQGKSSTIKGLYRESSSYMTETWVEALNVVNCK